MMTFRGLGTLALLVALSLKTQRDGATTILRLAFSRPERLCPAEMVPKNATTRRHMHTMAHVFVSDGLVSFFFFLFFVIIGWFENRTERQDVSS